MIPAERMRNLLPRPYTVDGQSVLGQLLNVLSLELEAAQQDIERLRSTHWLATATGDDVAKLAALVGVEPLAWESGDAFRARLLPLVAGRLRGSVGPDEIARFVFEYLRAAETALGRPDAALPATLVPGLRRYADPATAFGADPARPAYRPPRLVENPRRTRTSAALLATLGRVSYLHTWSERNAGLSEAVPTFTVVGAPGGKTAVPILVNRTLRQCIGYRGVVRVGQTLRLAPASETDRRATARLDGTDVSDRLFGSSAFTAGAAFDPGDLDRTPQIPAMTRGINEWRYLSGGFYDTRGLDWIHLPLADDDLMEAAFDRVRFDQALFPAGPVATIDMQWQEQEAAAFEVRVPRCVVVLPSSASGLAVEVADALSTTVTSLRAAGVSASLRWQAFTETQQHRATGRPGWIVIRPENAPSGTDQAVAVGARFGEGALGTTKFE